MGISWQHVPDTFHFKIDINRTSEAKTKRQVLSEITRLFDPLGWLSPIVVKFKCFVQEMWKRQLTWDAKLPDTLLVQWEHLQKDLRTLTTCRISQRLVTKNELGHSLELHVFCDASKNAYAAAVYSRVLVDNVFQTALLLQFSALLVTCHMKFQYSLGLIPQSSYLGSRNHRILGKHLFAIELQKYKH